LVPTVESGRAQARILNFDGDDHLLAGRWDPEGEVQLAGSRQLWGLTVISRVGTMEEGSTFTAVCLREQSMFEVTISRGRSTIIFRVSGTITMDELKKMLDEATWATDGFKGEPHIVLADLRGMAPLSQQAGAMMGEFIKYGRTHGTICCVHLSDSSISRLQAARLAREASPYDDITINVVSIEEADRVVQEKQAELQKRKK
jgi:hypothetical protein